MVLVSLTLQKVSENRSM